MCLISIYLAGVIWALSVLGFLYAGALSIPSYAVPLALLCFMFLFLLNPTRTFHHEARFWLLKKLVGHMHTPTIAILHSPALTRTHHPHQTRILTFLLLQGRVACAPFVFVQFADFWLGDQLNTLVQVLKDFEYSLCFYMQGFDWTMTKPGETKHFSTHSH